jgi:NDP-sugar pyrophosphorylase family protein
LLPVAGEPFARHQLTLLAEQGVTEVVYCIAHLGEQVREYVGDGHQLGLSVRYVDEGSQLRGTGGALRLAAEAGALREQFLVLYGDSYLPTDFGAVDTALRGVDEPALMTVFHNHDRWVRSNVVFDGRRVVAYDKSRKLPGMEWVDYGVSALTRDVVMELAADEVVDLATQFGALSRAGRLAGLEVRERFYEVGSPDGLSEVEALLRVDAPGHAPIGGPRR